MIKIVDEITLENFESWGQATDTKEKILNDGKGDEFDRYIEDCFPDGLSLTQLNDILAYDSQRVFEDLDIIEIETAEIVETLKKDNWEELKEIYKEDGTTDYELSGIIESNPTLSGQVRESQYNDIVEELDAELEEITEEN